MLDTASDKSKVLELAAALNRHDADAARKLLAASLVFKGVFGPPLHGPDAYISAMTRLGGHQSIKEVIAEGGTVACSYELSIPNRPGLSLFGSGWFTIEEGLITSIRVVFDSAPLAAA